MKARRSSLTPAISATIAMQMLIVVMVTAAQNPQLQGKVEEIKSAQAANKRALAQYTWQETETISIKGDVKDTKVYQVSVGPNGQQQKTQISNQQAQQSGRQGRVKQRVVEKAKADYQQYGEQIGALAKQYTTPDPDRLQQAREQGNISITPAGEGTVSLVIKNYVKPNDSVTLVFNSAQKAVQNIQVSSYLNDPGDAVTIQAVFAKLPDGTNHVSNTTINGVSKHLTVQTQNANYQKNVTGMLHVTGLPIPGNGL